MVCLNLTDPVNATVDMGGDQAQEHFQVVSHVIYGFLLPTVCAFGIVGNVLNLTILTRRKLQKSFRTLEQAANLCLISLAVSDLMFCIFAFPSMFLPEDDLYASKGVLLMYRVYCTAIINVFIMISTWLTVAMSLERYLAICHPLRQDLYLTTRRIKIVIALTYILSFIFNVPVLWRYEVQEICPKASSPPVVVKVDLVDRTTTSSPPFGARDQGGEILGSALVDSFGGLLVNFTSGSTGDVLSSSDGYLADFDVDVTNATASITPTPTTTTSVIVTASTKAKSVMESVVSTQPVPASEPGLVAFRPKQVFLWGSSKVDTVYRVLWAVVNNVLPLGLLIYFNVCLCRKIYRSYKMRQKFKQEHHSRHENSSHVLTVTLVVIVVMFFVLVAPSEIVIHVALLTNTNNSYTYMSVEAVMNFMQSLNFSVNFILYCIISPYFRKTLKYLFCCGCYNIYQVSKQWKKDFETSLM